MDVKARFNYLFFILKLREHIMLTFLILKSFFFFFEVMAWVYGITLINVIEFFSDKIN